MKCPRCSLGDISSHTLECLVCGFVPVGGVLTEAAILADLDAETRGLVESYVQPLAVLRRTDRSLLCFAEERETERQVLLKVLRPPAGDAPQVIERFEREMARISPLAHPHLVELRRFGASETACWYSREHAPGQTLGEFTRKNGVLDIGHAWRIAAHAAGALDYLHRRGITHGNLKPSNFIVDPRGTVRLSDGGIGRVWGGSAPVGPSAAAEDALPYLAPEYFTAGGALGPRADQYALAAVLFEALAGAPPFRGASVEDFAAAHRGGPPPSILTIRPELPALVAKALERALSKQPSARFPTASEFASAMTTPAAAELTMRPGPMAPLPSKMQQIVVIEPTPPPVQPPRRLPWLLVTIAVGVVAATVVAVSLHMRREPLPGMVVDPAPPNDLVSTFAGESVATTPPPVALREGVSAPPSVPRIAPPVVPRVALAPRAAPAHLFVNCTPWAVLSIDGTVVGNTPKMDLLVDPGRHQLVLARDGFQPYETVISLSAGQTFRLTDVTLQLAP